MQYGTTYPLTIQKGCATYSLFFCWAFLSDCDTVGLMGLILLSKWGCCLPVLLLEDKLRLVFAVDGHECGELHRWVAQRLHDSRQQPAALLQRTLALGTNNTNILVNFRSVLVEQAAGMMQGGSSAPTNLQCSVFSGLFF